MIYLITRLTKCSIKEFGKLFDGILHLENIVRIKNTFSEVNMLDRVKNLFDDSV